MASLDFTVVPGGSLSGELVVPGDKSISHRSVIFGSIAEGTTQVDGFLSGYDCLNTVEAFKSMGVSIDGPIDNKLLIHGVGLHGLKAPSKALDMGNSGTSMRLMTGLLAGQPFDSKLIGDGSLMKRPMERIVQPLQQMGAQIDTDEGKAPLDVFGGRDLQGIHYECPIPSAQVKSCLMLAGLYAKGLTEILEPSVTRDHTERMLTAFSYPVKKGDHMVAVHGGGRLKATDIIVPGDISSAAFFIVGATIAPGSSLVLKNVGVNPTRIGVIHILQAMGAKIELQNKKLCGDEPVADIYVRYAPLDGIEIPMDWVSLAIDEFPILFIAASAAKGRTVIRGAKELRFKESDRISAMVDGLNAIGIKADSLDDGAVIHGGHIHGGSIDSQKDHRIAMAFAMAGLLAKEPIEIKDCANVQTSYPDFLLAANEVGLHISGGSA